MAAPLNIDAFLDPIPGADPAGEPLSKLPYDIRKRIEDARKVVVPEEGDGQEEKKADWPGLVELAGETLKTRSKDLELAARMTEGLAHTCGFDGLADGLALLRGLLDRCWDRLYPAAKGTDLSHRSGRVDWLTQGAAGAEFPRTVRGLPLLNIKGTPVSLLNWAEPPGGADGKERLEKAVAVATPAECAAAVAAVDRAAAEMAALDGVLKARFGDKGPAVGDLREAIQGCRGLAAKFLKDKGPAPEPKGVTDPEPKPHGGDDDRPAGPPAGASRDDLLARLGELAAAYERLEKHSPVPAVVRYAVALGKMDYLALVRELVRNEAAREDLLRQVGLKDQPPE